MNQYRSVFPALATCNEQIDYSQVNGVRILPFAISLDSENSNLNPLAGEYQRFCYTIRGIGRDTSAYADLSHFLFGICDRIPASQLANISVVRDGVTEAVVFGDNVELRTPERPDPPTGCPGLKFDFGLDKVSGEMRVCFELLSAYDVGPIPVCLYGGGVTASGLTICGPVCNGNLSCPAVGYQSVDVCVPVTVTPYATVGATVTRCCGTPAVSSDSAACPGVVRGSCAFTITQRLCVAVPVAFGANATVGDYSVACLAATAEDVCTGCAEA